VKTSFKGTSCIYGRGYILWLNGSCALKLFADFRFLLSSVVLTSPRRRLVFFTQRNWPRSYTPAHSTPKHLFAKSNALLPCGLLSFLSFSPPMSILEHPEESNEIARTSDSTEAITAQGIPLCVGIFGYSETVAPDKFVSTSILPTQ